MTARDNATRVAAATALFGVLFGRDVQAYLDPGAGSMVFQVVVATAAAMAYGIRTYWGRLKRVFTRLPPGSLPEPDRKAPGWPGE